MTFEQEWIMGFNTVFFFVLLLKLFYFDLTNF